MHRIMSKKQHLTQQGVQFDGTLHVGYDLVYTYGKTEGKKFQLAEVKDANYRTEENPDSVAKVDNNHTYTYDAGSETERLFVNYRQYMTISVGVFSNSSRSCKKSYSNQA